MRIDMPTLRGFLSIIMVALVALGSFLSDASAQGTHGPSVIIRLRLAGDSEVIPPVRSCLADSLSKMPDVKVATTPTDGVRFIVDLVAAKSTKDTASASVVVAETFPMEQFRPQMKAGENTEALLTSIRYYTLLRLHELISDRSYENLCSTIAGDIADKVLSKEYTERND
jgi:hypothetical protein